MFYRLLSALILLITAFSVSAQPSPDKLTAKELGHTPEQRKTLSEKAMNRSLTLDERITAVRDLYKAGLDEQGKFPSVRICVWDIGGRSGPVFGTVRDHTTDLLKLGVTVQLEAYTSESILAEDLKAGNCDAALMTGLKARSFNRFTGTVDSVGAMPSLQHMKMLMKILSHPKMAGRMLNEDYVVLGVAPAGASYVFVNDRSINTLGKAAGKRVAVLDYDKMQARMVMKLGANPVPSDIVSAPNKFNNGVVDVLPAPLVAYRFMELYRGMEPDGGIINYPFSQASMQLIGRRDRFPQEVAQLMREDFFNSFDQVISFLDEQTGEIPDHWWIDIPEDDQRLYDLQMQHARIEMRDAGYYDGDMLALQRRIRCRVDPSRYECPNPLE